MGPKDVKTVLDYYGGIPEMQKWLTREREELEDRYNGVRGVSFDGLPHGSAPGRPTERLAELLEEQERLMENDQRGSDYYFAGDPTTKQNNDGESEYIFSKCGYC